MNMKPVESASRERELREQAQAWLLRLQSGQATAADADAFRQWCKAEPAHVRAFTEARRLWNALAPAAALAATTAMTVPAAVEANSAGVAALPPAGTHRDGRRPRAMRMGRRAFLGGAVAATAGWLIARPPLGLWPGWEEAAADYRTAVGELRDVDIAGVKVAMGARTALSREGGAGNELLELVQGEAQFRTPESPASPLRVRVGDGMVTLAPGSRVNLRCVAEDRRITCLSGQARVEQGGRAVVLGPSWQARLAERRIASVAPVDTSRVDAWRHGFLVFDNEPLARVVDEINRYRPGRILITRAELGRRTVQARIPIRQADTFLDLVKDVYGARVVRMPAGVTLLG